MIFEALSKSGCCMKDRIVNSTNKNSRFLGLWRKPLLCDTHRLSFIYWIVFHIEYFGAHLSYCPPQTPGLDPPLFPWVYKRRPVAYFREQSGHKSELLRSWHHSVSLFGGELDRYPWLCKYRSCALCHDVSLRELIPKIASLPLLLQMVLIYSLPMIHDHRCSSGQRPI